MVKYNRSIIVLKGEVALSITFNIKTLGCKVNQYESEAIALMLRGEGFEDAEGESADICIINTCTVTGESDRKCGQMIRKAIKANPNAAVLVIGCLSQVSPETVANIEGVDYVGGSANKSAVISEISDILKNGKRSTPKISVTSLQHAEFEGMRINSFGRTRAYIKIEDGCNNKCAYCIIPTSRGRVRSRDPEDIIEEIHKLSAGGCKEIVLTGIETDAYGLDFENYRLADLVEDVCRKTDIERIRFGSLDPTLFTDDFVARVCAEERVLPHFHISMQSGSSDTLKRMRRRYNADMARRTLQRIRAARPDVQFSADFIVGFPGESEREFTETLDFIKNERFITLHVFQYSVRKGTEAADMPNQVDPSIKKLRSEAVIKEQESIRKEIFSSLTGKETELLVERCVTDENGRLYALGHSPSFVSVKALLRSEHEKNDIIRILVTSFDADCIYGEEV